VLTVGLLYNMQCVHCWSWI